MKNIKNFLIALVALFCAVPAFAQGTMEWTLTPWGTDTYYDPPFNNVWQRKFKLRGVVVGTSRTPQYLYFTQSSIDGSWSGAGAGEYISTASGPILTDGTGGYSKWFTTTNRSNNVSQGPFDGTVRINVTWWFGPPFAVQSATVSRHGESWLAVCAYTAEPEIWIAPIAY